jgi:hypothetical protein
LRERGSDRCRSQQPGKRRTQNHFAHFHLHPVFQDRKNASAHSTFRAWVEKEISQPQHLKMVVAFR